MPNRFTRANVGSKLNFAKGEEAYEVKVTGSVSDYKKLYKYSKSLNISNINVVCYEKAPDSVGFIYPFKLNMFEA